MQVLVAMFDVDVTVDYELDVDVCGVFDVRIRCC